MSAVTTQGPGLDPGSCLPATLSVPLYRVAHTRTGDKGNRSNISVTAWHPRLWDALVTQMTESVVASLLATRQPTAVTRYLLPQLCAMNFVIDEVLDGGVNSALNLDSHGKCLSSLLLDHPITLPVALTPHLAGPPLTSDPPSAASPR